MQINIKTIGFGLILVAISVSLSYLVNHQFGSKKVAYVRSQELIYQYEGTKEAVVKFNNQKTQWQANVDTLRVNFQKAIEDYNNRYQKLNKQERTNYENQLAAQEQQLQTYSKAISEKITAQDDESMQAVLNQINAFVEDYSVKNGYDIVMGTTLSGSVLYGEKTLDITDDILQELNKNYRGE